MEDVKDVNKKLLENYVEKNKDENRKTNGGLRMKKKFLITLMLIMLITICIGGTNCMCAVPMNTLANPGGVTIVARKTSGGVYYYARNADGDWETSMNITLGESLYVYGENVYKWADIWWYKGADYQPLTTANGLRLDSAYSSWNPAAPLYQVTPSSTGTWTLATRSSNAEDYPSVIIRIVVAEPPDTAAPSVWWGTQPGWSNSSCTLYWGGSDNVGIARYEGSHDRSTVYDMGMATSQTWTGETYGTPFYIRAVDTSGNYSGWIGPQYIRIDKTGPTSAGAFIDGSPRYTTAANGTTFRVHCQGAADAGSRN